MKDLSIQIEILWSDGHKSCFSPDFFLKYGIKGQSGDCHGHQSHDRKIWKNDFNMPNHTFEEVTESNDAMFDFLSGKQKKHL